MPAIPRDLNRIKQQLAAIQEIHARLTASGIHHWLFGGWAVDFYAGRVTRDHADIDLAVWHSDLEQLGMLLGADGWLREPEDGDGFVVYQREAVRAEFAFLDRDEAGIIYTPVEAGRGDWP